MNKSFFKVTSVLLGAILLFGAYLSPISTFAATKKPAPKPYRYLSSTNKCYSPFDKNEKREYNALRNYLSFVTLDECKAQIKKPEAPVTPPVTTEITNPLYNNNGNSGNSPLADKSADKPANPPQQNEQKGLFNLITTSDGGTNRNPCPFITSTSTNNQSNGGCCIFFPFSTQNNTVNRPNICFLP